LEVLVEQGLEHLGRRGFDHHVLRALCNCENIHICRSDFIQYSSFTYEMAKECPDVYHFTQRRHWFLLLYVLAFNRYLKQFFKNQSINQ